MVYILLILPIFNLVCIAVFYFCFVAIEVSVKPASSSQITTKKITLNLTGIIPAVESVQDMSNAGHKTVNVCVHKI